MKRILLAALAVIALSCVAGAQSGGYSSPASTGSGSVTVPTGATPTFTTVGGGSGQCGNVAAPFVTTDFYHQLTTNEVATFATGASKTCDEMVVNLIQDNVGGHTFTWPANILNPPNLQTAANATTALTFQYCGPVGNVACPAGDWQATDVGPSGSLPNGGLVGQLLCNTGPGNGNWCSTGLPDGNGGVVITTTPYAVQCDSGTAIVDRGKTLVFGAGASVVNMPDSTATGCGGNFYVALLNKSGSTLTVNRGGADTQDVYDMVTLPLIAQTSFTLADGVTATLSNGHGTIWNVRFSGISSITQTSSFAAANPGTNGPNFLNWASCNGGNALSGNNFGGQACDISITAGGFGTPQGNPQSAGTIAGRAAGYNWRNGALRLIGGPTYPSGLSNLTQGSYFGFDYGERSPLISLLSPSGNVATASVRQDMPFIEGNGSLWRSDAVATWSIANGGTNYVVGDLVNITGNGPCPTNPTWTVSSVSGGVVTGLTLFAPDGHPFSGMFCVTSVGSATTTNSAAGSGLTISILTIGAPSVGNWYIRPFPCTGNSNSQGWQLVRGSSGNDDYVCWLFQGNTHNLATNVGWEGIHLGQTGGGLSIIGDAGGGKIRGDNGSLTLSANGQIFMKPASGGTNSYISLGVQNGGGTTPEGGGMDFDGDNNTVSGVLTTAFYAALVNGSGATINDGSPVKMSATANQVTPTTTTDTGSGVVIGVNIGTCNAAAVCHIAFAGFLRAKMVIGTGTCALGNFVIVDTTSNQDIKCTATYSAGTVIGVATSTASPINVVIGLR